LPHQGFVVLEYRIEVAGWMTPIVREQQGRSTVNRDLDCLSQRISALSQVVEGGKQGLAIDFWHHIVVSLSGLHQVICREK
jgi:hypothetical protein